MSSFFVGKQTIDAAATLILMREGPRSLAEITKVGKSLWLMNAMAMEQRYNSVTAEDFLDTINAYTFTHSEGVDFASILKAANCLLYQCNEGRVDEMALFKKLTGITELYADTKQTAEYEAAPWGLCG
jgi:hypothetical protein